MATEPRSPAEYHFDQAAEGLANIGTLAYDERKQLAELMSIVTHALLSIAATLDDRVGKPPDTTYRAGHGIAR